MRRTPQHSDRGETLIELVVAVAILGIAAVAILQGLMVGVQSSVMHRNDASGGAYVRSFAEAIQTDVDSNGYKTCANAQSGYAGVTVRDLPSGYTKTVTAVHSWNGSAWGPCTVDGVPSAADGSVCRGDDRDCARGRRNRCGVGGVEQHRRRIRHREGGYRAEPHHHGGVRGRDHHRAALSRHLG